MFKYTHAKNSNGPKDRKLSTQVDGGIHGGPVREMSSP